jgi:hypothetical protein
MNQAEEVTLVLHEDIDHDYFVEVAEGQGWIKYKTYPGDGQKERFEEVWTTQDRTNAIHYIDDPISGTRFLWVRGSRLSKLLFEINRRLPAYEPEELVEMLIEADTHEEIIDALFRIAVGFPDFDPEILRIFETCLKHPSPLIREATVQAIAYRLWTESIELLRNVANEDPGQSVRQFAQSILDQVQQTKTE